MVKVFGHFLAGPKLLLASCDAILMSVVLAAFVLTPSTDHVQSLQYLIKFCVAPSIVVLLAMIAVGLYNYPVLISLRLTFTRMVIALILVAPLLCLVLAFLEHAERGMPGRLPYWLNISLVLALTITVTRTAFLAGLDSFNKRRVLVIGNGNLAARILYRSRQILDCHSTAVVFANGCGDPLEVQLSGFAIANMKSREALASFVRHHRAREVVVAADDSRGSLMKQLLSWKLPGINIIDYQSFWERETCQLDLDALEQDLPIFSDGFRVEIIDNAVKRSLDIIASVAMLTISAPLLVATAIAIKLEGGPILYRQDRVGQGGKKFSLLKFRSMCVDAEDPSEPQWARTNDLRVTRIGSVIRKVRIDELPQLLNVLRNEMSLIGPRPERPYFVARLSREIPFYGERHVIKPGITGWAQIRYSYGASLEDARQKLGYDLYYIKHRTLFLDLLILIETIRIIFFPNDVQQRMMIDALADRCAAPMPTSADAQLSSRKTIGGEL